MSQNGMAKVHGMRNFAGLVERRLGSVSVFPVFFNISRKTFFIPELLRYWLP